MIDLRSVVEKYPECLDSATKFKSYMMDLYPDNSNKARIRILADIVDCGIALEIKNGKTDSISISNFCNTMENQYGYSAKLVEECVHQFLVAFGFEPKPINVSTQKTEDICKGDCSIALIGVGGAGLNTINRAGKQNGISLIAIDDGTEWLDGSKADQKIPINLGQCNNNTHSISDAEISKIDAVTSQYPIVVVCAGLGGKTGTKITPAVIQSAKKHGAMVITVMFKPFLFEGKDRANTAEIGEKQIKAISDYSIVIANELIKFHSTTQITLLNAFLFPDEVVAKVLQIILKCSGDGSIETNKKIIEELNHSIPQYKMVESVEQLATIIGEYEEKKQSFNDLFDEILKTTTIEKDGVTHICNPDDFIIEDGILKQYIGHDEYVAIPDGVVSIGRRAFCRCLSLVSVAIPNSVTNIEGTAFGGCKNLENITLPDGVTNVGAMAFAYCDNLTSVTLSSSVTNIGEQAFTDCINLKSIIIPNGVTSIGKMAFFECGNLTNITIPSSVTSIGDAIFRLCYNYTVYFHSEEQKNKFANCFGPNVKLIVKSE